MDVLRWPLVGPFLRWRHARTTLQLVLLAAAIVVVLHGFSGPDIGSANLATVLTWVHYRGLLVVVLLAAGNLFCTGCPFIRVRDWGRRLHVPSWTWPARLRGKWLAVALFVAVLVTYEWFDLWALPRATAWLVIAYFGAALVVDLLFKGATFCKHLCPVGQFNFMASTMSPLEVRIREQATCDSCRTADCISGRQSTFAPVGASVDKPEAVSAAARSPQPFKEVASSVSFFPRRSATSTARSASTACRRVRTTTSRLRRGHRVSNWPTIDGDPGSAVCPSARTSRRWPCCSSSVRC